MDDDPKLAAIEMWMLSTKGSSTAALLKLSLQKVGMFSFVSKVLRISNGQKKLCSVDTRLCPQTVVINTLLGEKILAYEKKSDSSFPSNIFNNILAIIVFLFVFL